MKNRLKIAIIFSAVWLLLVYPSPSSATATGGKKVVVVVVNAVNLEEMMAAKAPNLDRLIVSGVIGLMNARAGSSDYIGNFYLTLGAGARADAGKYANLGFNSLEPMPADFYGGLLTAKDFSRQNNDYRLPDTAVLNLSARDADTQSFKFRGNVVPGLLGESIKAAGKKRAAVGNADTLEALHREITLITMDMRGNTDYGDVSPDLSTIDKGFPGGLRTDYKKLAKTTIDLAQKADLIAVELGDTARVSLQRPLMSKSTNAVRRAEAIAGADEFIGLLKDRIDPGRTLLIVVSPQPQKDAVIGRDFLTPIIVSGLGKGTVISNTTKRAGLVANMDVAPTILDYLDIPVPVEMAGSPIESVEVADRIAFLKSRHSQTVAMRLVRTPLLTAYSLLVLAVLALSLVLIRLRSLKRPVGAPAVWVVKFLLLFLLSIPLAGLLQIPFDQTNFLTAILSLKAIAFLLAAGGLALSVKRPLFPLILIGWVTVLMVAYDGLTGTFLSERSFFGSDLIAGGRFYGLGNSYMGIIIGAALLALAGSIDIRGLKDREVAPFFSGLVLTAVAVVVGHPKIGANVGGLITGTATAVFFGLVLWGKKATWRTIIVGLIIFTLIIAVVLSFDRPGRESKSHSGKTIAVIKVKGAPAILDIIARKLTMNIRGTLSFPGFVVLVMSLILYLTRWATMDKSAFFTRLNSGFDVTNKGFMAMVWAAVGAFLFNDTGAVAAASILVYLLAPLFFILLDERNLSVPKVAQDGR